MVSLRWKDWNKPVLFAADAVARGHYGHGRSSTFRLAKGKGRVLDIVESRVRRLGYGSGCLPPKPMAYRHVLRNGRYVQQPARITLRPGCH